jgi:protein-S-isoprenylcysteine O-methyltransferase Ste14
MNSMNDRSPPDPAGSGSARSLAVEAVQRVTNLFRKEMDLARAEFDAALKSAAAGIGLLVAAVVLALTALNVLSAAVVAGLANLGIAPGWAALIVGLVLAGVALGLAMRGASDLKQVKLMPERVSRNVKADAETIREGFNG